MGHFTSLIILGKLHAPIKINFVINFINYREVNSITHPGQTGPAGLNILFHFSRPAPQKGEKIKGCLHWPTSDNREGLITRQLPMGHMS